MTWEGDGAAGVHKAVGGLQRQLVQREQRGEEEAGEGQGDEEGGGGLQLQSEEEAAEVQLGQVQAE